MRFSVFAIGVVLSFCFSGCMLYTDRHQNYLKADSIKDLEIPEDLKKGTIEALYPIPSVSKQDNAFFDLEVDGFEVPRPEPMSAERLNQKVRIQKVGERQWILLEASSSQVWPLAQSFLSQYGIPVSRSVPKTGLIETDWVTFKDDESTRSRFQVRIEKGLRPDTTEVHFLNAQTPADSIPKNFTWPQASDSPEQESWLLTEMANLLAVEVQNNSASLLGQAVGGQVKAQLLMEDAEPILQLDLDYQRAWASVQNAVKRPEFASWDENGNQGIIYARFLERKLNTELAYARGTRAKVDAINEIKRIEEGRVAPYDLETVLKHLQSSEEVRSLFGDIGTAEFGDPSLDKVGFLIRLVEEADRVVVKVRDIDGSKLDLQLTKQILLALRLKLV